MGVVTIANRSMCKSHGRSNSEFSFNTAVRGFHICSRAWLELEREQKRYNVALRKLSESEYSDARADDDQPIAQVFLGGCKGGNPPPGKWSCPPPEIDLDQ